MGQEPGADSTTLQFQSTHKLFSYNITGTKYMNNT